MADTNLNIKVTADTGSAVNNIQAFGQAVTSVNIASLSEQVAALSDNLNKATPENLAFAETFNKIQQDLASGAISVEEARDAINKLNDEMGKAPEKTEKYSFSLTDLKAGLDLAKEAASAFAGVFKQAFEMGKEGAVITQTAASLTNLAQEAGYAGDLIGDLEAAAGGTVDDLDYMGSALKTLTGTSGDLQAELAQTLPELLNISRAVVKLNPTLGTSADVFDAMTRALQTGQTRGLKPYGFQIDATATAQEQLTQIMEQGAEMVTKLGGNVESAVDKYSKFENAIDNVKDALSQTLDQMIELDKATNATQAFADYLDLSNQIQEAFDAGNITLEQRNELVFKHDYLMQNETETMSQLTTAINENKGALDYAALAIQDVTTAVENQNPVLVQAGANTITWANNSFYAQQGQDAARDATVKAQEAMEKAQTAAENIATAFSNIGLAAYEAEVWTTLLAVATGKLSAADAEAALNLLDVQKGVADGEIAMGDYFAAMLDGVITTEEYARLMGETKTAIEEKTEAEFLAEQQTRKFTDAGQGVVEATPQIVSSLDLIASAALNAAGDYDLNFRINVYGDPIPNVGGTSTAPSGPVTPTAKADGGAVSTNSLYLVGEKGPEFFVPSQSGTIIPAQQTANLLNGGESVAPVVYVFLDGQQIAAAVEVRNGQRARQVSGAYRP